MVTLILDGWQRWKVNMWLHMMVNKNMVMVSRKEKISHSVEKIEKKISSSECEINFLRKRGLHSNQFIYAKNDDNSVVDNDDIVRKLPKPAMLGGTLRTARILTFIFDFSSFENVISSLISAITIIRMGNSDFL
ncbi:hypothetical protein AVEN_202609-1 [Araneus ventricosus]|uniref:Uncharacterized protein n=1 Tax=Araneus ventricosus TaxID=182803 RepID=A0A4Y2VPI7_ARAVE|nr:hypothetical protein AVEN_202609-1 [Araneus ventricosus]